MEDRYTYSTHIHTFQQILFLSDFKKILIQFFILGVFKAEAKISKCFVFFDFWGPGLGVR